MPKTKPPETALRVWRANRIDQEELLDDNDIIDGFWECEGECFKIRESRPLDMQLGTHIAVCLNATFEQPDFQRFSRRNWEFLLDAMEHRNGTLGE